MWRTVDPDGRIVVLTDEGWHHIVVKHPELVQRRSLILETVASPDEWLRGRGPGEEWFYSAGPGFTRWLRVVVHFRAGQGIIVTGFPRRSFP